MQGLERTWVAVRKCATVWLAGVGLCGLILPGTAHGQWWSGYARNAEHTAYTPGPSQLPQLIRWQTAIDLNPQYSGDDLLIHYGSPAITQANTILVPVKTGATGDFVVNALNAATGAQLWTLSTDYVLPPHNWTPPMGVSLTPGDDAVVVPGAGGTVWVRTKPNAAQAPAATRIAFFGLNLYNQDPDAFNTAIQICTPITVDSDSNLYFGYLSSGAVLPGYPNGIPSGLARLELDGTGTFVAASTLAGDATIQKVVYNCAPGNFRRWVQGLRGGEPEQLFLRLPVHGRLCQSPAAAERLPAGSAQRSGSNHTG